MKFVRKIQVDVVLSLVIEFETNINWNRLNNKSIKTTRLDVLSCLLQSTVVYTFIK